MAEHLNPLGIVLRIAAWGLMCGVMAASHAEGLADPTRPPAVLGEGGMDAGAASGPVLQSVLISPTRRVAVISGRTVRVGDKVGEMTVAGIMDGAVTLRRGKTVETLKLFPGIEKHSMRRTPSAKSEAARNKGK